MAACPVQAIAGILPKRKIKQSDLVISDRQFPTTTELLILHKKGVKSITFEDKSLMENGVNRIEQVNGMLQELGQCPFLTSTNSVEEEETCSRREFFLLWKKESKSLMKEMTPAKWRFNHKALDLRQYYTDYQFTNVKVDIDKCSLCHVCERVCEQKCFAIQEEHFSLSMKECTSCGLCADVCPEQAILIEDKILTTKKMDIPIYEKECKCCKNTFKSVREHDEFCTTCTKLKQFL
ncbi:4Fe-4S binding protein [Niallia sp. XMNu-256]|uniref:4Fe-4S binding protein n=1 Tax=Niallia sp. XMNu-256 TaxID=3082444 RepID=UPI0030CD2146